MGVAIADAGVRLTYVSDVRALDPVEQERITEDILADGALPADGWLAPRSLTACDMIVLAEGQESGRCLGVLAASNGCTGREEFLFIESAYVTQGVRRQGLMGRMIALALLRRAGQGVMPQVIATRTSSPAWFAMLRDLGGAFAEAEFYPELDTPVVNLPLAALARRVARAAVPRVRFEPATGALRGGLIASGVFTPPPPAPLGEQAVDALFADELSPTDQVLAVLDLRANAEETLIDDARRIYKRR
jgi:hypothetical protein